MRHAMQPFCWLFCKLPCGSGQQPWQLLRPQEMVCHRQHPAKWTSVVPDLNQSLHKRRLQAQSRSRAFRRPGRALRRPQSEQRRRRSPPRTTKTGGQMCPGCSSQVGGWMLAEKSMKRSLDKDPCRGSVRCRPTAGRSHPPRKWRKQAAPSPMRTCSEELHRLQLESSSWPVAWHRTIHHLNAGGTR